MIGVLGGLGAESSSGVAIMKEGIHPDYVPARVTCACGNTFVTRATVPEIRVDICSNCHPFFTGRQKIVDTERRVERFRQRYERYEKQAKARKERPATRR
jgi:large subunit ribosomal protein L31